MFHQRWYLLFALLTISSPSAFAQDRKPEVFVGYSNLQAEGLPDRDDSNNFFTGNFFSRRGTLHGGNAEVTFFPFEILGITADVSFNRKHRSIDVDPGSDTENTDVAYLMAGPSYAFPSSGRFQPFARVLIGLAHTGYRASTKRNVSNGNLTTSFDTGSTDFAMGFGGGLDVKVAEKFKVRVIQIDYAPIFLGDHAIAVLGQAGVLQPLSLDGKRQDNIRFSFGVTF